MLNPSDLAPLLWRLQTANDTLLAVGPATAQAVSTSPNTTGYAVGGYTAVDSAAIAIPDANVRLHSIVARLTSLAGGATSLTWWLAMDSAGNYPITDKITTLVVANPSLTSAGTVSARLDLPYRRFTGIGSQGYVYLFGNLDAGTGQLDAAYITFGAPANGGFVDGVPSGF